METTNESNAVAILGEPEPKSVSVEVESAAVAKLKTLDDLELKIKQILAVTFLVESRNLRGADNRLSIEQANEIYRKTPTVYFYINKQRDHIMNAIREYLRNQKAGEKTMTSVNTE